MATSGNAHWVFFSAAIVVGSLVLLYTALGNGDASKVVPMTAAYPAVTLLLAVVFLGERLSGARLGGAALVITGVVILTKAS